MDNCNVNIACTALKINHDIIVQDIQGDVIEALYDQQVLTEVEFKKIKSLKNREKEARLLLELLPLKGKSGINQFINYLSLYYSWIADSILSSIKNENDGSLTTKMKHALTLGEVPQLSSRHVSRTDLVTSLKQLLIQLQAGHFVVVNGMNGCGKSSLIAEVLNDPLILMQYLQGIVQWINVGREHSLDVGRIQTEILNRLNDQEQVISPPLNTNDVDYEVTRKTLQHLWKSKKLTNGLLVLDDVCSNQIVKYLDIGCKILITTHDTCIMEEIVNLRVKYFKVNEGFEENETLSLFSKCLNVKYSSLPPDASKIHKICKGFPLIISLIAAQLESHREDTINNSSERWKYYLKTLSNNPSEAFKYTLHSDKLLVRLENAITMCIKSLPIDLQNKYYDFALFVHDLNIKPEVLSVLWNLNKTNVEDIMLELINKNLAVRVWNQPLNSYVYSVHDLLLSYLKKLMNCQQLKELHIKLIKRYKIICNGNFAELPKNDNYIFLYFGYHLKNADMLEEFPRWFLNLKFLESKICATGPADLLADLKKYRKYIAIQSIYEEYIKEIEHFVKCIGPSLYQTKCDIIQLGLQELSSSFIYNESYKIAKNNGKSYFYTDIRPSHNCFPKPYISIVRDKIESAIFGNEHDEIIIGTGSGSIKVWNVITHKCLYTYNGHTSKVTHLVKNKSKNQFLSTSADSTIRIWNLNNFPESDGSETRTPSPESRQEHWQNAFDKNYKKPINITDCLYILKDDSETVIGVSDVCEVTFAQFSSNNQLIVSSSSDRTLKIWKLFGGGLFKLIKSIKQNSPIHRCYFMEHAKHDDRIIFSTRSRTGGVIYGCQWPFEHCTGLKYLKEELLSFFLLPGIEGKDNLLVLTPKTVNCYQFEWDNSLSLVDIPLPISYQQFTLSSISEMNTNLLNNTRYIAFSLINCTIQICDLSSGYNFLELNDPIQGMLSLDWFWSDNDQCNWLLCAAEDKSIRLWCLNNIAQYACANKINTKQQSNSNFEKKCKNEVMSFQDYKLFSEEQNLYCYKLKQNFDAVCLKNDSILVAAITQCESLKIIVEHLDQWSIIDKRVSAIKILHSDQSVDQTAIIVAFNDLSVHMLKYKTAEYLFDSLGEVNQIFGCFENGKVTVALIRKKNLQEKEYCNQTLEVWSNTAQTNKHFVIPIIIKDFMNCFVSHGKVIVIHNFIELVMVDVQAGVSANLEIENVNMVKGSLVLNDSNFAVSNRGSSLSFFELTNDPKIKFIVGYSLPFKDEELTPMSLSNNKKLIVVGGQMCIALIDQISGATKHYTIDSCIKNIQSMIWSSDDTHLAIKTDNQIITIDMKSGKKIASVRITAKHFISNSSLTKYITVNTAGQLVVLSLCSNIDK